MMKDRNRPRSETAGFLIALALATPGLGQAATCTIAPPSPAIAPGQSVTWSYTSSGFSRTPTRAWTFQGGSPSSSTNSSRTVSYAGAGTFTTSLKLTRGSTVANCSTTVRVTAPDTSAPTVPGSLTATAAGTSQINLTWAASTDNVAVTGYRLERCTGSHLYRVRPDRHADHHQLQQYRISRGHLPLPRARD